MGVLVWANITSLDVKRVRCSHWCMHSNFDLWCFQILCAIIVSASYCMETERCSYVYCRQLDLLVTSQGWDISAGSLVSPDIGLFVLVGLPYFIVYQCHGLTPAGN